MHSGLCFCFFRVALSFLRGAVGSSLRAPLRESVDAALEFARKVLDMCKFWRFPWKLSVYDTLELLNFVVSAFVVCSTIKGVVPVN